IRARNRINAIESSCAELHNEQQLKHIQRKLNRCAAGTGERRTERAVHSLQTAACGASVVWKKHLQAPGGPGNDSIRRSSVTWALQLIIRTRVQLFTGR